MTETCFNEIIWALGIFYNFLTLFQHYSKISTPIILCHLNTTCYLHTTCWYYILVLNKQLSNREKKKDHLHVKTFIQEPQKKQTHSDCQKFQHWSYCDILRSIQHSNWIKLKMPVVVPVSCVRANTNKNWEMLPFRQLEQRAKGKIKIN